MSDATNAVFCAGSAGRGGGAIVLPPIGVGVSGRYPHVLVDRADLLGQWLDGTAADRHVGGQTGRPDRSALPLRQGGTYPHHLRSYTSGLWQLVPGRLPCP